MGESQKEADMNDEKTLNEGGGGIGSSSTTKPTMCKWICSLFSEYTCESKVETRFGERSATTSRRWKSCADNVISSLIRLVLAIGLVAVGWNMSCSIKSVARHDSPAVEHCKRGQEATKQILAATAALSNEVERLERAVRECDECAERLAAATADMGREPTEEFMEPCWQTGCPFCFGRCE